MTTLCNGNRVGACAMLEPEVATDDDDSDDDDDDDDDDDESNVEDDV